MKPAHDSPAVQAIRCRIGENIRSLRIKSGFTQQALSEIAGIAVRHLQKIEQGSVNITIGTLAEIAQALGCEITAFLLPIDVTPEKWKGQ